MVAVEASSFLAVIPLYKDSDDQAQHDRAMRSLALELRVPEVSVRMVYEDELRRLMTDVHVREFLVVFARRGARECLICEGKTRKAKCATRSSCRVETMNAGGPGIGAGNRLPESTKRIPD